MVIKKYTCYLRSFTVSYAALSTFLILYLVVYWTNKCFADATCTDNERDMFIQAGLLSILTVCLVVVLVKINIFLQKDANFGFKVGNPLFVFLIVFTVCFGSRALF